jgi:hypothetical protein
MQLLDRRTDSWTAVLVHVARLAHEISDTDMVPEVYRGNPAAITAIMLAGREVGLPPMRALGQSFLVNGRVSVMAEAQRGLVLAAGHDIEFDEEKCTGLQAVVRGRRVGGTRWHTVIWTLDMARAAGLLEGRNRHTWKRYPRQMLKARASAELCRDLFADVVGGYATVEELGGPATDYGVDDAGEHTTVTVVEPEPPVRRKTSVRGRKQSPRELPAVEPPPPVQPGPVEPPLPGDPDYQPDDDPPPNTPPATETNAPTGEDRPLAREPADTVAAEVTGVPDPSDRPATRAQITRIVATFDEFGIANRADRLEMTSSIAGRTLTSANDLTRREAGQVIDVLEECRRQDDPAAALDQLLLTLITATDPPPAPDGNAADE